MDVTVTVRAVDGTTKDIVVPVAVTAPATTHTLLGVGGGNTNPTYLEGSGPLGVRRLYYHLPGGLSGAVSDMKVDHAAGRIPWVSFKLDNTTWAQAAAGSMDSTVKSLNSQIAALGKEVWVCFHHEPEGDGVAADFRAMQDRLIPLMTAPNVRCWIILTGWTEMSFGDAEPWTDYWPAVAKPYGIGIDPYNWYGTGSPQKTSWDELSRYYPETVAFAQSKGVQWGVAEFGIDNDGTLNTAKDGAHWIQRAYAAADANGCRAMAYFDTNLNNPANCDWRLSALAAKQADFMAALQASKQ